MPTTPTAVVGIGCRFPGASSPEAFWRVLQDGVDAVSTVPADRWSSASYYSPDNGSGKTRSRWGGFIEGIDQFDAAFFGISPREAERIDPQQRLLLEVTHEAFEDAGIPLESLSGQPVGVYVGGFTLDYMLMQLGGVDYRWVEPHTATGSMMTLLANRLSYVYGFTGPSVTVDTACSSSLTAAHLALRGLRDHECDIAVVAGVNALLTPAYTIAESRAGMLSPTGRSRAFDSRADGYVRGEGAGAVILRRLDDVRRAGQRHYAVVRGSAVNQDGRSDGLTVPSGAAQQALMRTALAEAQVEPRDVAFIEAHGTGTPVGDPIEADAIGAVLGEGRDAGRPCLLGSVKTNIGHLEAAAGVAGLIKASLALHHGQVPAHLHLQDPNPAIDLAGLRLRIPTRTTELRPDDRYACVNSFGFGGANAHVVLERADVAAPSLERLPSPATRSSVDSSADSSARPRATLLPLSAKSPAALAELSASYADFLRTTTVTPAQVAATAAAQRDHHPLRRAVVGTWPEDLADALSGDEGAHDRQPAPAAPEPLVFLYSGMGPQWLGMGQELYATEPVFRAAVDDIAAIGDPISGWSLVEAFTGTLAAERMEETEVAQPANFALQVGLTELWRSWGVHASSVVGHSAGEPAAAWAAGILSLQDAVTVSYARSMTQQSTTGKGRLMAVGEPVEQLRERLARHPGRRIDVAAVNSPTSITVVGDDTALQALARELEQDEVFHRGLTVKVPYHSFYMEDLEAELVCRLADIRPRAGSTPIVSTVTGTHLEGESFGPRYWYDNVRQPVDFAGAVETLVQTGVRAFLELGPHPVLGRSVVETAEARTGERVRVVSSLQRGVPERETLLRAAGELYSHGTELSWPALLGERPVQVTLPRYPWQHSRHWSEPPESAQRHAARPHPLVRRQLDASAPQWEVDLDAPHLGWLVDHRIEDQVVLPAACYTELAIWAGRESYGDPDALTFQDLRFSKALYLDAGEHPRVRLTFDPSSGAFEVRSAPWGSETWATHSSGRLNLGRRVGLDAPPLQPSEAPSVPSSTVYAELADLGLDYGPEFRVIQGLRREAGCAEARVTLSPEQAATVEDYVIHPLLIDAAFQVLALAAHAGREGRTLMPVEVAEGRLHGRVPADLTIRAEVRPDGDDRGVLGDIVCYDLDGTPVLRILGCRAQDLQSGESSAPMEYFGVDWQEPVEGIARPDSEPGRWVLSGGHPFGDVLAAALGELGAPVTRLSDGAPIDELRTRLARLGPVRGFVDLTPLEVGPEDGPDGGVAAGLRALQLFQACADLDQVEPPRLWFLTCRSQPVLGDVRNSLQATVWGVGRVAGQVELPSLWGGLVDVDEPTTATASVVAAHLLSGDPEDQVAVYGGRRYVPRMRAANVPRSEVAPLRRDGAYLITGGLGALGLVVAEWMVTRGARHLVLVGRRGLPPRSQWSVSRDDGRVRAVQALEARGATVETYSCDVADVAALAALRDQREREGRVPVIGVVHAAGTSTPKLVVSMTEDDFRSITRAKVQGGWALDQVFPTGLDIFVLFSSIASLIVSAGQANYAAGNAYLDSLAHERRSRGEPASALNWGPWGDVGMATRLDLVAFFRSRGLMPTTSTQGTTAVGRLLACDLAQVAPIAPDWPTVLASYPLGVAPRMLEEMRATESLAHDAADQAGSVSERLAAAAPGDRPAVVDDAVRSVTARVLRYAEGDLPVRSALTSLGLDSMIAIELKARLEKTLPVTVPIISLLKGSTLADLVAACQDQLLAAAELDEDIAAALEAAEGLDIADIVEAVAP